MHTLLYILHVPHYKTTHVLSNTTVARDNVYTFCKITTNVITIMFSVV